MCSPLPTSPTWIRSSSLERSPGSPGYSFGTCCRSRCRQGTLRGVTGLIDFGRDELLIGLCAEGVPCGEFAREALDAAGVIPATDTNEPDVRALLTKIEAGELDAGITYVSDVVSAGGSVEGIDIPEDENVVAVYPIAVLAEAASPGESEDFVDFVLSTEGQAILVEHGFAAP